MREDGESMAELQLLTDDQLRHFIVNGYVVLRPELDAGLHERIFDETETVFEKEGNPGNNLLPRVPAVQQVLDSPEVRGGLTSVLGEGYYTQPHRHCHFNPPGSKGQDLHQDGGSRWSHHTRRILLFYYPQDTTEELGPTAIVPGSHYYATREGVAASGELPLCGQAGTVAIVHYDLFHRATPNRSDRNRYMMKFLFARTAEPRSPSWRNDGPGWPADGSALDPDPPGGPDRRMHEHVWDWHCGRTTNGTAQDGQPVAADPAEGVAELLAGMEDGCEADRLRAAYALSGAGSAAAPGLTRLLRADSQELRRNACHALSAMGEAAVGPLIDSLRGGAAEHERAEAAETLGDIGLAAGPAIPSLTGRLRDESPQVRAQAAEALGTIAQTDPAAAPALAGALGDESDLVRRNAAFALVRLGPHAEAAIPALGDVLYDKDRYVRGDAAQALLRIGTRQAWETVRPFLETSRWCPLTTRESTY